MAHIMKPMKEKAEYSSFKWLIVVPERSPIDKNWRNTDEDGTREDESPCRPRWLLKIGSDTQPRYESGHPLVRLC